MLRKVAIQLHRWVGLSIALFLVVAGLTGSILAFQQEIDALVNPQIWTAAPTSEHPRIMSPIALRQELLDQLPPGYSVNSVRLEQKEGVATRFWVGLPESVEGADDEYFVHSYTGEILGSRRHGDLSQGLVNVVPFIYELHYSLALGETGTLLFGIAALLWTLDCFVAAYLTFPRTRRREGERLRRDAGSWLTSWWKAWRVKTGSFMAFTFSGHRAAGLWVWLLLVVFAWSSVMLNLNEEVYKPAMSTVFSWEDYGWQKIEDLPEAKPEPGLSWEEAQSVGSELLQQQADEKDFEVLWLERLRYNPGQGHFQLRAITTLDISDRYGATAVWFDGDTGELSAFDAASGQATGNTITSWLFAIHMGMIRPLGVGYRIFLVFFGLTVAFLSVSGVVIWWRKRSRRRRRSGAGAEPAE